LAAKGEFALVQEKLETALDKHGQPVRRGTMAHDHHLYMLLTEAAARQRNPVALAAYAPRLADLAARDGHRLYQAIAARAQGVASRLAGDAASAMAHLQTALELCQALGMPWQTGCTLNEQAELLAEQGRLAEARGFYAQAQAAFEAVHARPDLQRTEAALRALASG
jgi:hypothetical protein